MTENGLQLVIDVLYFIMIAMYGVVMYNRNDTIL